MLAGGDIQGKQGRSPSSTEKRQRHPVGKGLPCKLFPQNLGMKEGKKKSFGGEKL